MMPRDGQPIMISRWSGMGDVCMALCAAQAYKAMTGGKVYFYTAPSFRPLSRACRHVTTVEDGEDRPFVLEVPLHDSCHGLANIHEVDSFCAEMGLVGVDPFFKTLDLKTSNADVQRVDQLLYYTDESTRWVVLHPASKDPNRTWPRDNWVHLAEDMFAFGLSVILIGSKEESFDIAGDLVAAPMGCGFMDLRGELSIMETVELLRHVNVLVSTDGGPIQLAGASNCSIVGLYSVVSGFNRFPYRDPRKAMVRGVLPTCSHFPCYREARDPATWAGECSALEGSGITELNDLLRNWCPAHPPIPGSSRYHCLTHEITTARVARAILEVL
jgi:ADP-heptose:LPS heptosyltransferase